MINKIFGGNKLNLINYALGLLLIEIWFKSISGISSNGDVLGSLVVILLGPVLIVTLVVIGSGICHTVLQNYIAADDVAKYAHEEDTVEFTMYISTIFMMLLLVASLIMYNS